MASQICLIWTLAPDTGDFRLEMDDIPDVDNLYSILDLLGQVLSTE